MFLFIAIFITLYCTSSIILLIGKIAVSIDDRKEKKYLRAVEISDFFHNTLVTIYDWRNAYIRFYGNEEFEKNKGDIFNSARGIVHRASYDYYIIGKGKKLPLVLSSILPEDLVREINSRPVKQLEFEF